jgi:hypothetical protein
MINLKKFIAAIRYYVLPFAVQLGWLGTYSNIMGALLVAFGIMPQGYSLFIGGSVMWGIVALAKRDNALFCLNAAYLLINFIGLYRAVN